jgi:multicomponent Na+:H+ antiporter subunit D
MIGGVLLALGQWDFKRLLAYHSISQVGYIALGLGLATPLGFIGAIYHLVNHAAFKSLLFLNAGSVEYATSNRNLKQMGGLSSRMPVTGLTSLVASMSIAGIPPLNGFWSKLIIIIAAFSSGHYFAGGVAALVSFLTLASFLKVQRYAFWGEYISGNDTASSRPVKESPLSMTAPMAALALICIALGIFYPQVRRIFIEPAASTIVNVSAYPSDILASASPSPTQSVATVK